MSMNPQDRMSKSASVGSLSQAARPPRPPSAGSARMGAATVDVTSFREWTASGSRRTTLEGVRQRPVSASLAGQAASARSFSSKDSSSRPQSAGSQSPSSGWLPSMPKAEGPREYLLPPPPGRFGGLAPPLPPLPAAPEDFDRESLSATAAGVASKPLPDVEARGSRSMPPASDSRVGEDPDSSVDFTEEELALEREVEQALNELEAVESAMAAMRLRLENAVDDERVSNKELAELKAGIEQWQKTAEAGLRELGHRQDQLDAALATSAAAAEEEEAAANKVAEEKRLDMAAEKVKVLESQTSRLADQVAEAEVSLKLKMEEHRRVQQQVAMIEDELKAMRQEQRDMRSSTKALENEIREHEAVFSGSLRKRQALERQVVQLRGEASGLHARVASLPAPSRPATAPVAADATSNASQKGLDISPGLRDGCVPTPVPSVQDVQVLPGETARDVSLRLQQEVVNLWAAMRHCEGEVASGAERLRTDLPVHALPAAAA